MKKNFPKQIFDNALKIILFKLNLILAYINDNKLTFIYKDKINNILSFFSKFPINYILDHLLALPYIFD
jgi:hypothetical protein